MLEAGSVGDLNDSTAMRHDRPLTLKTAYWFALIILLSSCSHDYELMKMEEQVSGYGSAIRWNLFKKAVTYLDPPPLKTPDWNSLAQVKVTSYRPQYRDVLPSGMVMMQSVEISFIPPGSVVEKTIVDQQRWRFDEDDNRWVLESGFPALN